MMLPTQLDEQIKLFEDYYNIQLKESVILGFNERYLKLDYFIFCGMMQHIFDNFYVSRNKAVPNFVDFNAARAIIQGKIKPERTVKLTAKERGPLLPQSCIGAFSRLMQEIHMWYDEGVYWLYGGKLQPLPYPRNYKSCMIYAIIAKDSEKYLSHPEKLEVFYKKNIEKLRKLRLKRKEEGHFQKRKKRFGNL